MFVSGGREDVGVAFCRADACSSHHGDVKKLQGAHCSKILFYGQQLQQGKNINILLNLTLPDKWQFSKTL